MEYIWGVEMEDDYEMPVFFRNPFKAMEFADEHCPVKLSWYQISETWWRGMNAATDDTWSVVRYELRD
jgi:hypothetical protein